MATKKFMLNIDVKGSGDYLGSVTALSFKTIDQTNPTYLLRADGTLQNPSTFIYDDSDVLKDADALSPVTAVNKLITQSDVSTTLDGYLPLSAGSSKSLTGDLYINNSVAGKSQIFLNGSGNRIQGDNGLFINTNSGYLYLGSNNENSAFLYNRSIYLYNDFLPASDTALCNIGSDTRYFDLAFINTLYNGTKIISPAVYSKHDGVPLAHTSEPDLQTMALFEDSFKPLSRDLPYTDVAIYTSTDGSTWTLETGFPSFDYEKLLRGDNVPSNLDFPNGTVGVRIELKLTNGYRIPSTLYMRLSSRNKNQTVKIYARDKDNTSYWEPIATSDAVVLGYPAIYSLNFEAIKWGDLSNANRDIIRIEITTDYSVYQTPWELYKLELWGYYVAFDTITRNHFTFDHNLITTFPNRVKGPDAVNNDEFVTLSQLNSSVPDVSVYQLKSEKGSPDGYASLDSAGKVPATQLPAYVDDVQEYADLASFPTTGTSGIIYIALDTLKTYRWGGSTYSVISETISLGNTNTTAFWGDKGQVAYNHSQAAHAPSDAEKNVQSDWNESNTSSDAYILNKPSIPAPANNPTITITAGTGLSNGGSFTLNQASSETITINHLTSSGYKHIPGGGAANQYLKWSAAGTATWAPLPSIPDPANDSNVSLTAGKGLSGGGSFTLNKSTDTSIIFDLDFSELTDMIADISGSTEFILQNGSTESRKAASEIKLSAFNNDKGWTSGGWVFKGSGTGTSTSTTGTKAIIAKIVGSSFKIRVEFVSTSGADTSAGVTFWVKDNKASFISDGAEYGSGHPMQYLSIAQDGTTNNWYVRITDYNTAQSYRWEVFQEVGGSFGGTVTVYSTRQADNSSTNRKSAYLPFYYLQSSANKMYLAATSADSASRLNSYTTAGYVGLKDQTFDNELTYHRISEDNLLSGGSSSKEVDFVQMKSDLRNSQDYVYGFANYKDGTGIKLLSGQLNGAATTWTDKGYLATQTWVNSQTANYIPLAGSSAITGDLIPANNDSISLGSSSNRYSYVYATQVTSYGATLDNLSVPTSFTAAKATVNGDFTVNKTNQPWGYDLKVYSGGVECTGSFIHQYGVGAFKDGLISESQFTASGGIEFSGFIQPKNDAAFDLGSSSYRIKNGYFSGNVTAADFIMSSDISLKENIKPINDSDIFREFNFKNSDKKRFGVIAQEVEEKYPEVVSEDKEGLKVVSYTDLLVKRVAELEEENKKLRDDIEMIKKKLGL